MLNNTTKNKFYLSEIKHTANWVINYFNYWQATTEPKGNQWRSPILYIYTGCLIFAITSVNGHRF